MKDFIKKIFQTDILGKMKQKVTGIINRKEAVRRQIIGLFNNYCRGRFDTFGVSMKNLKEKPNFPG